VITRFGPGPPPPAKHRTATWLRPDLEDLTRAVLLLLTTALITLNGGPL
jgi:hypothetical protein